MARTMDAITIAGTAPAVARRRHATAHPAAALFPLRRPIVPGTRRCLAGLAACLGRSCCLRRSHCRGAGFVGAGRADAKCCVGQHDYPLTLRPPKRSRGCLAKLCASQRCGGDCMRRGGRNRPCSVRIFGQPGQFPLEESPLQIEHQIGTGGRANSRWLQARDLNLRTRPRFRETVVARAT